MIKYIRIEFEDDTVRFAYKQVRSDWTGYESERDTLADGSYLELNHVILLLSLGTLREEIHIDRRTGLTYIQTGKTDSVSCPTY